MIVSYVVIAFFGMLGMMLLDLPIAVAMAAVGVVGGIIAYGAPLMNSIAPVVWGVHNDNLLTSIPLFVLMGELLLRSGIAERMFGALAAWLGRLPGGLLPARLKIRYVPTLDGAPVDPQIATSCRRAVDALAAQGHRLEVGDMSIDLGPLNRSWAMVGQTGLASLFAHQPMWATGSKAST